VFNKQYMNYMYEMTGEIKETPWEDYGVKVPQIAWQTDRKEEEEEMESPILPSKSEPTNFYDPNDVHRLHRRHHSMVPQPQDVQNEEMSSVRNLLETLQFD
jgi:hypothetical protein